MSKAFQKLAIAASFAGLAACSNPVSPDQKVCKLNSDGGADVLYAGTNQAVITMNAGSIVRDGATDFHGTADSKGVLVDMSVDTKRGTCLVGSSYEAGATYKLVP